MPQEKGMDEVNALVQMISLYSKEQDSYDRHSATLVFTAITILGAVLGGIIALMQVDKGQSLPPIWGTIAVLFLIFPIMATLFLYVFALNCRKGAVYRGYVSYLEKRLNSVLYGEGKSEDGKDINSGTGPFQMDSRLWEEFILGKRSKFNGAWMEAIATVFFVSLFLVVMFLLSLGSFLKIASRANPALKGGYAALYALSVLFCTTSCVICLKDLLSNEKVRVDVEQFCTSQEKAQTSNKDMTS